MKLRRNILFAIASILGINVVSAQSREVRFLIDTCIEIMKQNAANADKADWDKLKNTALIQAANIDDPRKLGPAIRYLYQSLGDFHGSFYYKDSIFHWEGKKSVISDSIMNEWKKGVHIQTSLLDNHIGYLRIPSMPYPEKKDADRNAQMLNDSLCSLLEKNVKGIILDLRLDGGGAMFPMILGLEQLLSAGRVGSFVAKKGSTWYVKDNNFLLDTTVLTSIVPKCTNKAQNLPIVMLIGPGTGSSGEFLVIAFKGRKNTVLLGSKSAGFVTSVAGFPINEAAYMLLSTGYGSDRNGKIYTEAITPDIPLTSPDSFNNIEKDEKVKAAVKWLKGHSK